MDLLQLRYFLEVASREHVTRSAEKLHIAQSALTQAIHKLENELGVPLFLRRGRGIILTDYGRYLKNRLGPILQELDSLPDQLQTMASLSRETIHLNVLAASSLVMDAVISYRAAHDRVNFQLLQNAESELYDIGITTRLVYQPNQEAAQDEFVCGERIFLAVPDNERYHNLRSIHLQDVRSEGFISLLGSRQMRSICDKFCQHAGFQPRIIFESDSPAAVRNMIAANMGVGFWPEFSWGRLESDSVLLLDIEEPICRRDLLVTLKRNKPDCAIVEDFFHFLTAALEKAAHGQ